MGHILFSGLLRDDGHRQVSDVLASVRQRLGFIAIQIFIHAGDVEIIQGAEGVCNAEILLLLMVGLRFVNGPDEFVAGCDGILIETPHVNGGYIVRTHLIFCQILKPVVNVIRTIKVARQDVTHVHDSTIAKTIMITRI